MLLFYSTYQSCGSKLFVAIFFHIFTVLWWTHFLDRQLTSPEYVYLSCTKTSSTLAGAFHTEHFYCIWWLLLPKEQQRSTWCLFKSVLLTLKQIWLWNSPSRSHQDSWWERKGELTMLGARSTLVTSAIIACTRFGPVLSILTFPSSFHFSYAKALLTRFLFIQAVFIIFIPLRWNVLIQACVTCK